MRSEVSQLEAALEVVTLQLSTSQAVVIAEESECNQSSALIDTETKMRQDLEVKLAEVQRRLDDHSSILCFSHKMFCYDAN